jgi:hypothetical protein
VRGKCCYCPASAGAIHATFIGVLQRENQTIVQSLFTRTCGNALCCRQVLLANAMAVNPHTHCASHIQQSQAQQHL